VLPLIFDRYLRKIIPDVGQTTNTQAPLTNLQHSLQQRPAGHLYSAPLSWVNDSNQNLKKPNWISKQGSTKRIQKSS